MFFFFFFCKKIFSVIHLRAWLKVVFWFWFYGDAIDEIMDQEMDPLEEEHFGELLKQWKKVEDDIKDRLSELESEFNESG